MMGQLMAIGRTVWGPKVPPLKGTEASLSYAQYFLYLVSSSVNVFIFHITSLDTFWIHLYAVWKWELAKHRRASFSPFFRIREFLSLSGPQDRKSIM